jgi:hypothetical protein
MAASAGRSGAGAIGVIDDVEEPEGHDGVARLQISGYLRGVTAVLQSLKSGSKQARRVEAVGGHRAVISSRAFAHPACRAASPRAQTCCVKIDGSGMEIRWEDDSKTLQGLVFLKPEVCPVLSRARKLSPCTTMPSFPCQPRRPTPSTPPRPAPAQLFSEFACGGPGAPEHRFGLQLSQLLDTLAVFTSTPGVSLDLAHPGPNGEVLLE